MGSELSLSGVAARDGGERSAPDGGRRIHRRHAVLESKVRLERLAALGAALESGETAAPHGLMARLRDALPDWKELGTAIGWGVIALLSVAALIAVTLAAASVLLIALWYVLQWVTALPRWIRRQIVA